MARARSAVVLLVVAALVTTVATVLWWRSNQTDAPTVCAAPPSPPVSHVRFAEAPDPRLAERARWRARIETTCGLVEVRLDGGAAPASVASFVELARSGYWTDSVCNRLTTRLAPTRLLQCGDPTGRRLGKPGYELPLENLPADRRYRTGQVAVARGPEVGTTAGQFVFVHADFTVPVGEPLYSVIGEVTSGQAVIERVAAAGGEDHLSDWYPFQSISVRTVSVERE